MSAAVLLTLTPHEFMAIYRERCILADYQSRGRARA